MTNMANAVSTNMSSAMATDWIGAIGSLFAGTGREAEDAAASVKGFGDVVADTGVKGGAGVDALANKVGGLKTKLDEVGEVMKTVATSISGGISGVVKDVISGGDAIGNLISKVGDLGDKLIDMAFNQAINGLFSVLGLFGGGSASVGLKLIPGLGSIPGLATGGRTLSAGLVEVGERGKELLNLPAGAQVIRNADIGEVGASGGDTNIKFEIDARGATRDAGPSIANEVRRVLPDALREHNANPNRRKT